VLAVLVFILIVMWSVYFGMGILSARERRSMNSIAAFNEHLAVLARTTPGRTVPARQFPGAPSVPAPYGYAPRRRGMTLTDARNRRRHMLTGLAAAVSVTAALAVVVGGTPLVAAHLLADGFLVGYLGLLIHTRRPAPARRSTVIYLPRPSAALMAEPVYLQRSAN
jgi:hypothetical protein